MADVVKTVIPAGGGDYTLYQVWEEDADGVSTAANRWVAEGYKGNGGPLGLVGWTHEDTRVYGAPDNRPTGAFIHGDNDVARMTIGGAGATLDCQIQNIEFDGIQINYTGTRQPVRIRSTAGGCVMKNFVCDHSGAGDVSFGLGIWSQVSTGGVMPRLINGYVDCTAATALRAVLSDRSVAGVGFAEVINCVLRSKAGEFAVDIAGAGSELSVAKNVYGDNWTNPSKIISADGCASEDTSAPGTNTVHNVVEADAFENVGGLDVRLKAGSVLIDAGVDVSAISEANTDIIGTSRPQGDASDIGPQEVVVDGKPIRGRWSSRAGAGPRRPGQLLGRKS